MCTLWSPATPRSLSRMTLPSTRLQGCAGATFLAGQSRLSKSWQRGADRADRRSGDIGRRQRAAYRLHCCGVEHKVCTACASRPQGESAWTQRRLQRGQRRPRPWLQSSGTALPLAQARGGRTKRLTAAILMCQEARECGSWKDVPRGGCCGFVVVCGPCMPALPSNTCAEEQVPRMLSAGDLGVTPLKVLLSVTAPEAGSRSCILHRRPSGAGCDRSSRTRHARA
jgi:hypothetical protein